MHDEVSRGRRNHSLLAERPDLTSTELWRETEKWFMRLHEPSFGKISNAEDLSASPDGSKIAFTASIWTSLKEGLPGKCICFVNFSEGEHGSVQRVTQSPNSDKLPKWSPDGKTLAFLSDRLHKGHFLLYAMDLQWLGEARLVTSQAVDGVVEDFEWSADSNSLLYSVTPYGTPMAGAEGSGYLADSGKKSSPSWMPTVKSDKPSSHLRSLWKCDATGDNCRQVSRIDRNVWSFCWAGFRHAFAKVSQSPVGYSHQEAVIVKMNLSNGDEEVVRARDNQMVGKFVSSTSGDQVVVIESAGSERVKIVGNLTLINATTKKKTNLPTNAVDVGCIAWFGPDRLFAMGLRNMHSVALEINTSSIEMRELWSTTDTCGGTNGFARASLVPDKGFAVVRNNWKLAPEIGFVDPHSGYHQIVSFDHDGSKWLRSQLGSHEMISWKATDGLDIYGLLYLPMASTAPHRTILYVHGGPFSAVTDRWLGYNQSVVWLVAHGYAVLCPNPRGSVGRGAKFTDGVKGDIGGGDAQDLLSGLDHLIKTGIADGNRLGVIGASYGGYMASWLVTQTTRFSASVAGSPVCDYKLQWICGDERMPILGNQIYSKDSIAELRSPLANVQYCKTPTLVLAGTKDNCTPPQHAQYFHQALLDQHVKSVLAEYPREGHGVRLFPEIFDAYSRILNWFDTFL